MTTTSVDVRHERSQTASPQEDEASTLGILARTVLAAGMFMAVFAAAGFALRSVAPSVENWLPSDPWAPSTLGLHFVVALLYTGAVAYPILRSRWSGARLVATVYWALAGITVLLPWIELVVFNLREVSPEGIGATFVLQAVALAAFAPGVVAAYGRLRSEPPATEPNPRLRLGAGGWSWRLVAISVSYLFIYFIFGALVAWRAPEIREFYADVRMPGLGTIALTQLGRGLVWAAVAIPVVRMMRGTRLQTVLTVGVLFGVVMSAGLLLPNPLLPADVRAIHLMEVTSSNFLFGLLVGWLLTPPGTLVSPNAVPRRDPPASPAEQERGSPPPPSPGPGS